MNAIFKLALKEIRNKKFFAILMFFICLISMHMLLSSFTNATSANYQQKIFESHFGHDMGKVLHLDYQYTEENPSFADTLAQYINYISDLPGVKAVGQFDVTGMYFSELKASNEYSEINSEIVKDGKYARHADIAQLLRVDEAILSFIKGGISEYSETTTGNPPIYASTIFRDILPIGTLLTDEWTGSQYEVAGYVPLGSQWLDENDLIRFPLVSMDGWFIAPFTADSRADIMTQLCCLHNTYVLLEDNAETDFLKDVISGYPAQHDFKACAHTLTAEYDIYRQETDSFTFRQITLAIFISVVAMSSIVAVFTTNTLLKRKYYGILIANGFTLTDIVLCISTEITIILFPSALTAWVMKLLAFSQSNDLFRDILLTAHIQYTIPTSCLIVLTLIAVATLLPAIKVFQYQPCELIGGNRNGNH